jgi:tetratricopeptide (TPR) repeat protein
MVLKTLVALLIAFGSTFASAQGTGRAPSDYYFNRPNSSLLEQLNSVELHHLPACEDGPKSRRYAQARDDCDFILRYFPNHPRALVAMAEICLAWKDARCEPDVVFERAIAINPRAYTTYVARGIYLLRAQKANEAVTNLEQAAALNPNSINVQYNLGLAYIETKQFVLANEAAQRAYALGAPVPGLREKLRRAGYWKESGISDTGTEHVTSPAASDGEQSKKSAAKPSRN